MSNELDERIFCGECHQWTENLTLFEHYMKYHPGAKSFANFNEHGICGCFGNKNGCVIRYVRFNPDTKIWKRDKGSVHDTAEDGEESWDCVGCGAKYGNIHHTECDDEKCPKCGGQLFSCDCNGDEEDEKADRWGHIFLTNKTFVPPSCEHCEKDRSERERLK